MQAGEQPMSSEYPQTKMDLLARVNASMAELDGVLAPLSDERLSGAGADGGWSIKDHLYHLGTWRRKQIAQMRGESIPAAIGVDQATWDGDEIDAINAAIEGQSQAMSAPEALAYFRQAHSDILTAIGDFPEEGLAGPGYADDPESGPMVNYIAGNTYEHDEEHLGYIRALLQES
jgi:hypothetical protein